MKKLAILFTLLLLFSSTAQAVIQSTARWEGSGSYSTWPNQLTIEDGETAVAASGVIHSFEYYVTADVNLLDSNHNKIKTLESGMVIDTTSDTYFTVDVNSNDYNGPGTYYVKFDVWDHNNHDVEEAQLIVEPVQTQNTCPVFTSTFSSPVDLNVGQSYQLLVSASDVDADTIQYTASNLPGSASWSPVAGGYMFSWTPTSSEVGQHVVDFSITDGEQGCLRSESVVFNVHPVQVCDLVFDSVSDRVLDEGQTLHIDLGAIASQPIIYAYQFQNTLVDGITFNPDTGDFYWETDSEDAGVYYIDFFAVVSQDCQQQQTVMITVNDVQENQCPAVSFDYTPNSPLEGQTVTFTSTSTDADGDVLQSSWDFGDGASASGSQADHVFSASGQYVVELTVSDGECTQSSSQTVVVEQQQQENNCPVADFDFTPNNPDSGDTVTFTSTSSDADNDVLQASWDFNNDGVTDLFGTNVNYAFNSGSHPVTLTVSDGQCSGHVTKDVNVQQSCELDLVSIDCLSPVVEGDLQSCTVQGSSTDGWLGGMTMNVFYSDHNYAGFCITDTHTGACNAQFQAPGPGTYTVYAVAERNGCVGDLSMQQTDTFEVFADKYEIADLAIYNSPDFTQQDYEFYRSQDMFVRFTVLDEFQNPVDNAVTSVKLLSGPGGVADFTPYLYTTPGPGGYDYFLQIPPTHDFLGQSQVFVFQFDFVDGSGAQRVVGVNIINNPPEVASEGVVVMGSQTQLDSGVVTLNVVDPEEMTASFTIDGELVADIQEGYWATLSDGRVFHVHDIDYDNNPYTAIVSITADDYLDANVFTGQSLSSATGFDLSQFKSDVEDSGSDLVWSVSDVDSAVFDVQLNRDVMTVTPVASGTDTFTLTVTDLDGATDSYQVTLSSFIQPPAACEDGQDNDGDGFVDMADLGCDSPSDDDEYNVVVYPQCSDGEDNDFDGLVDFPADPGCSSAQDDDEYNLIVLPQCEDGIDNDNDGLVDFPEDSGCDSLLDDDEFNAALPQCSDGLDNDGDGLVDLDDPDCVNANDDDESGTIVPACSDGLDNDADGLVDMDDPGCTDPSDNDEYNEIVTYACSDGQDNDGDGLVDFPADPGCISAFDNDEYNEPVVPQCSDGLDNDNDGRIDFTGLVLQSDALTTYVTAGTIQATGNNECNDGIDNDMDGEIDYPQDAACSGPTDNTEGSPNQCADGSDNDGDGLVDYPADPDCENGSDNSEGIVQNSGYNYYMFNLQVGGEVVSFPVKVHSVSLGSMTIELSDGTTHTLLAGQTLEVSDGFTTKYLTLVFSDGGQAYVVVQATTQVLPDPDCESAEDNDESGTAPLPQCSDNIDNDGDGRVDFGEDRGCDSWLDNDEFNVYACNDGKDNDGDGFIDLNDPGCDSLFDDDEYHTITECSDGLDNDGDGYADLKDEDCDSWEDDSEYEPLPQCSDNLDNDQDGLIDMYDPDCTSPDDNSEYPALPQCSDGLDNDGDGRIDMADLHCYSPLDDMEGEIVVPAPVRPWSDRDDLLITRIDVNGFDVEMEAVEPGEYIMLSVSLENTLDYGLDDVKVKVFLDDYGLWATKTIHELDAGERITVNMHVDVPAYIAQDVYDLRFTASNDDIRRVKYRQLIVV